ncbi:hypothetical protein [Aquirhabdus sp.]|uniref:hypothetical protein n=1 Tax=Aquirhabdus sp. TaxID=2824160 RepID=UPI00396C5BDB
MQFKQPKYDVRNYLRTATVAGILAIACAPSAFAAQFGADVETPARAAWRDNMHQLSVPEGEGCFHAAYPSTKWEKVSCVAAPGYRSKLSIDHLKALRANQALSSSEQVVAGNGYDFVAQTPSGNVFSKVVGTFPSVTGVTSEKGANVPFGSGQSNGIIGTNEYTLQLNTNISHTPACGSYTNCLAWVQYVMSTNTPASLTSSTLTNKTEVFVEYWLFDYGTSSRSKCPSGFVNAGADSTNGFGGAGVDCVQNTPATVVYNGQLPITEMANVSFSGSVAASGNDIATVTYGGQAYSSSVADSKTGMSSGWTQAEYNVVGNAGGSQAQFNAGSTVAVKLALTDGSTAAPTCLAPSTRSGTTGETNNLTLGSSCTVGSGATPYIQFTESN